MLLCVMSISLNLQLADNVGWVVEGMKVDPVVMRRIQPDDGEQTHLTARKVP